MGDKHEDEAKAFRDYVEKAMGEFVGERLDDPTLAKRVAKKLGEIVESIDMPPSITLAMLVDVFEMESSTIPEFGAAYLAKRAVDALDLALVQHMALDLKEADND